MIALEDLKRCNSIARSQKRVKGRSDATVVCISDLEVKGHSCVLVTPRKSLHVAVQNSLRSIVHFGGKYDYAVEGTSSWCYTSGIMKIHSDDI